MVLHGIVLNVIIIARFRYFVFIVKSLESEIMLD